MYTHFEIRKLLTKGKIESELELERALIAERSLKHLSREDAKYKRLRKKLRDIIEAYEKSNWSKKARISTAKIKENDIATVLAEKERVFFENRKAIIRERLKSLDLTQQQLGELLGHKSKSYISELVNGVTPFTLKDLIVINRVFKIDLSDLIPTLLPETELRKIKASISKLNNKKLTFDQEGIERLDGGSWKMGT